MKELISNIVLFILGRIKLIKCRLIKEEAYELCRLFMLEATVTDDEELGKYFYHTLKQYSDFYNQHGLQFSEVWDLLNQSQKKTIIHIAEEYHKINK